MDYTSTTPSALNKQDDAYNDTEQRIRKLLKTVVPEDVYDKWIEHFVFEKIDGKEIIIGYYGKESLKKFKKEYKEIVWINICSIAGYSKKFKIHKRKEKKVKSPKKATPHTAKTKKNIKAAQLFAISLIFTAITLCVAIIGCNYIINRNFKECFYNVSSLKVNNKIRIIQISDLHRSSYGKDNSKLIDRVNKLNPDIIIYTGDCLDSSEDSTEGIVNLCTELAQVAPSYYIYGNNEAEKFYDIPLTQEELDKKFGFSDASRDPAKLLEIEDTFEKELEAKGVKVLKNETDTVVVGTTKVDVHGVLTSNPSAFWSYDGDSFDKYIHENTNNMKITAIHEPLVFEEFSSDFWGDVMLCGHTHGGTVRIPMLGPVYTHEGGIFPERSGGYVYGRYEVSGKPMIISSGLDNKNLLRINNQPELVIIDVNRF